MPELLHPGVYVFEISSGVRPIEGVSTSTAAFIGIADKGPVPGTLLPNGKAAGPLLITSYTDYVRQFGGFRSDSFLTYAVRAFFDNGGRRLYIVRIARGAARAGAGAVDSGTLTAATAGAWANLLSVAYSAASNGDAGSFDLVVSARSGTGSVEIERLKNLPFATAKATVNSGAGASKFVRIPTPPAAFAARPANTPGLAQTTAGVNGAGTAAAVTTAGANGFAVNALQPGTWANTLLAVRIQPATSGDAKQFDLEVSLNGVVVERFRNLAVKSANAADPIPTNYARTIVNDITNGSRYVTLPNDFTARPTDTPSGQALIGGTDGAGGTASAWGAGSVLSFTAANEGKWGNNLSVVISDSSDGDPSHFRLSVFENDTQVEAFDALGFAPPPGTPPFPDDYAPVVVNSRSEFISIGTTTAVTSRPPNGRIALVGGVDGTTPAAGDYIGLAATSSDRTGTGFHALDKITDVNIVAAPGQGDPIVVNGGMSYCKNRPLQDCFYIGDVGAILNAAGTAEDVNNARTDGAQPNVKTVADARAFATTGFNGVQLDLASGDYGAIYYPWVWSLDPIGTGRNPRILLPPSGFMAGIYARTDNSRGVFKAPAGTEAGVSGAIAVATTVSDTEQDTLNPIKVNVIRTVPGSGIVVWGTRTIGSDAEWRYIPVRRVAIFLRVSIYYGIQWAVFEPNDEPLWASLRLNIRSFMLTQFRAGAFQGSKPDDAFFVKCDSDTTTQADIDAGVVNILVGFAPLKPAEFVVLKLQQKVNQQVD